MISGRWRSVLVVVLRLIITVLFAPPVLSKLLEHGKWAHQFVRWGYPAWGALATSAVEILGLVALWIPSLVRVGIGGLAVVLVGAACTWLIHGPSTVAAYPGIILMFIGCLAWLEVVRRPSG